MIEVFKPEHQMEPSISRNTPDSIFSQVKLQIGILYNQSH